MQVHSFVALQLIKRFNVLKKHAYKNSKFPHYYLKVYFYCNRK